MDLPVTAVYDANTLYPAPLRDLLIRLSQAGLVQAKWTDAIHDEWIRNVLKNRPDLSLQQLERTKNLMDKAVPDCLVSGHDPLISSLALPDPDDRHVLAAAIHSKASVIVTYNLKDFPANVLSSYDIQALHPDDFLSDLIDSATAPTVGAVKRQRASLRKPPMAAEQLLEIFQAQELTQFVARLLPFASLL